MARFTLEKELLQLNESLLAMGILIENTMEQTIEVIATNNREIAKKVVEGDDIIDDQERIIEQKCLLLIARQQPIASDLRTVGAALKVITDLERIGDQCNDICEVIIRRKNDDFAVKFNDIPEMARLASLMVNDALEAYIKKDLDLAIKVRKSDDAIDDLYRKVKEDMVDAIRESKKVVDDATDLMFMAKHIERIADHATNVAEWATYIMTGIHPQDKDLNI